MENHHTLSLTRWHKVAERLMREYAQTSATLKEGLGETRVLGHAGPTQIGRLRDQREQLEHAFGMLAELEATIVHIREALAKANAQHGIAEQLARHDWLMRRQRLLEALLATQRSNMIDLDDLSELEIEVRAEEGNSRYNLNAAALPVRMMTEGFETRLVALLAETRTALYALTDELADRNRVTLTLSLPESVARLAGLG